MRKYICTIIRMAPLLAFATLAITACKKHKQKGTDNQNNIEKIYVAGSDVSASRQQAKVWKNGTGTFLPGIAEATTIAQSVFVHQNDVYIVGSAVMTQSNGQQSSKILLWKNNVLQNFPDGAMSNYPRSVFVSGNDVYIAGYTKDSQTGVTYAKVWKNGVGSNLAPGAYAVDVCVHNGDVYVAGYGNLSSSGTHSAGVWKNGVLQPAPENAENSLVTSIHIFNNDIYLTGTRTAFSGAPPQMMCWKNGAMLPITQKGVFSKANSVYVQGNDVYIAGQDEVYAAIWKNGQLQRVGGVGSVLTSIWATAQNVYATGAQQENYKPIASIWKDGVPEKLSEAVEEASANGLFVK